MVIDKLRTFYYPGSVIPDETLKACALYFDEIHVQDHMHVGKLNLEGLHTNATSEVFDHPDALNEFFHQESEAGFVHLYGEYSHLRFLERTRVLQEEGILNIDGGLGTAGVATEDLFEEKTLLRGLKPEEYTRVAARALAFGYMTPLFISNHWHEPLKHTGVRRIVRMILESLFEDVFATSQKHSALPITDDPVMKQQLEIFVARFIRKKKGKRPSSKPSDTDIHGFRALQNRLPSLLLRSYDDVLEARHRLEDELLEFRDKVKELTNFIRSNGLAGSAEDEARKIQALIDLRVTAIERKVTHGKQRFYREMAKAIGMASPPALMSNFYPDMPIALLVAAFTVAAAGNALSAWQDYRESREELNDDSHGVSYLIRIKDEL